MKKLHLLATVYALTSFTMISNANAAIVASEESSFTSTGQSTTQTLAVSPASSSDAPMVLTVPGDSVQTQPHENKYYSLDGTLATHPHNDSRPGLWVLLIIASVFGLISEIHHRRFSKSIT